MREAKQIVTWLIGLAPRALAELTSAGFPACLGDSTVAKAVALVAIFLEAVLRWLGELNAVLAAVLGRA